MSESNIRSFQNIEVFHNGKWIERSGIISPELLCKNPDCNRKPRRNRGWIKQYCSKSCAAKHTAPIRELQKRRKNNHD